MPVVTRWCLFALSLLLVLVTAASCSSDPDAPEGESSPDRQGSSSPTPFDADPYDYIAGSGTAKMAAVLDTIESRVQADPTGSFHLNTARADHWLALMQEADSVSQRQQYHYAYAQDLLLAGETESALYELAAFMDDAGISLYRLNQRTKPVFDLLATSYLRMGALENAADGHSPRSYILPIAGSGLHTEQAGARRAAALLTELLRRVPQDLQSRWLLNIAHMMLGQYPEDVPERYLIPGIGAKENTPIQSFANVAGPLGVDHDALGGGVSIDDFNGDGFLDIFTTSHALDHPVRLYLNDGDGGFVDRTKAAGLENITGGSNTAHADYDNDGDVDILVLRGGGLGDQGEYPNSLLRNKGDGTFDDVTYAAGLATYHPTQTAAWGDFNQDGWLDLFVGNESGLVFDLLTGRPSDEVRARRPSALYLNNRDGTFTDVAEQVGIRLDAHVKGADWGDVNNDGRPDLYVSVLGGKNHLYINQGGTSAADWTFTETAEAAGVQAPLFGFSTWFWDVDNDGDDDLFVSSYDMRYRGYIPRIVAAEMMNKPHGVDPPRLYQNNGDGTFTEATKAAGLGTALFSMGANYGDIDNDGYQDFYAGTGAPDLRALVPNRLFHNQNGTRFQEVSYAAGVAHIQKGHAVAFADLDRDGDQDIYAVMGGTLEGDAYPNVLFENPGHGHNWITLILEGRTANRSAIGARVRLVITDAQGTRRTIHRTVSTGGSFGASSLQQEIGLGTATQIDTLTVTWPNADRTTQTFEQVRANQIVKLTEGADALEAMPRPAAPFKSSGS